MMTVSAIIPTHNRSALLRQAIESVLAVQHENIELEVLVVDDGSVDDTAEVVKNYPVTYLRQKGSLGPAGTRNAGIEAARGEYIAFLDDDDLWLPTNLIPQLEVLRAHPDYALVFGQLWGFETSPEEHISLYRPDIERPEWHVIDLLEFAPSTDSLVIRRSVAQQFRFDPSLRMGEDWDWALRIAKSYPLGYVAVPVALMRRNRPDHKVSWGMVHYSTKVLNRHIRTLDIQTRRQVKPIIWKRRNMYSKAYIRAAKEYAQNRQYYQAVKALWWALYASPARVAGMPARFLQRRLIWHQTLPDVRSTKLED